jgi:chromosome segregation ATPase
MNFRHLLFLLALAGALPPMARAQDAAAAAAVNTRLREALRTEADQLQSANDQVATLQAAQAQSAKDNADLKAKLDAVSAQLDAATKQSAADKVTSDTAIAGLKSQNADLTAQLAKYASAIDEWKTSYNQMSDLARTKEAERADLAGKVIALQRLVEDRERKNLALYQTANEILTRYERFGLGDALDAKEPFVGSRRVYLQTLVQDYKDKLLDQTVKSGAAATILSTPAPKPAAASPAKPLAPGSTSLSSTPP